MCAGVRAVGLASRIRERAAALGNIVALKVMVRTRESGHLFLAGVRLSISVAPLSQASPDEADRDLSQRRMAEATRAITPDRRETAETKSISGQEWA